MAGLSDFIQQYVTPYDPDRDTYRRPPFAQPVKAGKNSPIYNAHSYHTKVPPEGIVPYIEHYTDPGDLILDPFCGSGMTGVAALMTGRHAILNDLSPAAVHIARNYTTPVDVKALEQEFKRIKAAVKEEFDWLYGTTCDHCGGPATIQHTIWSDVFECGRCGGEIVLWDVAVNAKDRKIVDTFTCPTCSKEQTKKGLHRVSYLPVVTNYECPHCNFERYSRSTSKVEILHVAEIEGQDVPYWYPSDEFPLGRQTRKLREGTARISRVDQLYTRRNLWALARLWHDIGCSPVPEIITSSLRFIFTSIIQRCSRLNRLRPSGAGDPMSGVLYVASLTREDNVLELWERKLKEYLSSTLYIFKLITDGISEPFQVSPWN